MRDAVETLELRHDGAFHGEGLEHLAGHEAVERFPGRSLDHCADENPASDGVAVLRARRKQQRVVD